MASPYAELLTAYDVRKENLTLSSNLEEITDLFNINDDLTNICTSGDDTAQY